MKRKRIVMISPYFPYPPHDGGKVRIYNLIKHLSAYNDIYFLSYVEPGMPEGAVAAMKQYCREVITVVREENRGIVRGDIPRCVSFFYTHEMIKAVENTVSSVSPDLVQIDFLIMTKYIDHIPAGIPVIYTEHDMSTIDFEQSFHDRDLPEKLRFVEWTRLMQYEKSVLGKCRSVIVLTERDQAILREFLPGIASTIITTGVDVEFFRPYDDIRKGASDIAFLGHYKHYPNYDAVQYFIDEIFPGIVQEVPSARFIVIGSGIRDLEKYANERIIVTGELEDVREHLGRVKVFAAPVRLGGGIKGKILEAMAMGVPVVATEEASKGIRCRNNLDIIVVRTAKEFAEETVRLLKDESRQAVLSSNARKLVEEEYDWRKIAFKLDEFYASLC